MLVSFLRVLQGLPRMLVTCQVILFSVVLLGRAMGMCGEVM
jgi:hypothetical protein